MRYSTTIPGRRCWYGCWCFFFVVSSVCLLKRGSSLAFSPSVTTTNTHHAGILPRILDHRSVIDQRLRRTTAATSSFRASPPVVLRSSSGDDNDDKTNADKLTSEPSRTEKSFQATQAEERRIRFMRQDRVQAGYTFVCILYGLVSLRHVFTQTTTTTLASLYYLVAGGPVMASAVSYILQRATNHDRLGSDTYKRLNLSLLGYALTSLGMAIADPFHFAKAVFVIPPSLLFLQSAQGYRYGVVGWDKAKHICAIFPDLGKGFRSTLATIVSLNQNVKRSFDYQLMTWMVGAMGVAKVTQIVSTTASSSSLLLASRLSRVARFVLWGGVLVTLKDGADRDRLSGTTFRQLNGLCGLSFGSLALYLLMTTYQAWSSSLSGRGYAQAALGLAGVLFAGISTYNTRKYR